MTHFAEAAREAARRDNGQFGTQARAEGDGVDLSAAEDRFAAPLTLDEWRQVCDYQNLLMRQNDPTESLKTSGGWVVTTDVHGDFPESGIVEEGQYTALRFDADGNQTGDFSVDAFTDLSKRSQSAQRTAEFLVRASRPKPASQTETQPAQVDESAGESEGDVHPVFGEVIHSYSRADALRDGALRDYSELAAEAGFKHPLAMTAAAYSDAVAWSRDSGLQDETGRAWDVLMMASIAARRSARPDEDAHTRDFLVYRIPNEGRGRRPTPTRLRLHIGPGDDHEPVMTIMTPGED